MRGKIAHRVWLRTPVHYLKIFKYQKCLFYTVDSIPECATLEVCAIYLSSTEKMRSHFPQCRPREMVQRIQIARLKKVMCWLQYYEARCDKHINNRLYYDSASHSRVTIQPWRKSLIAISSSTTNNAYCHTSNLRNRIPWPTYSDRDTSVWCCSVVMLVVYTFIY